MREGQQITITQHRAPWVRVWTSARFSVESLSQCWQERQWMTSWWSVMVPLHLKYLPVKKLNTTTHCQLLHSLYQWYLYMLILGIMKIWGHCKYCEYKWSVLCRNLSFPNRCERLVIQSCRQVFIVLTYWLPLFGLYVTLGTRPGSSSFWSQYLYRIHHFSKSVYLGRVINFLVLHTYFYI